jgi:lipopolysaccharide exporter
MAHAEQRGLRQQAARGIRWTASATGINAGLNFLQTAVLAHFLVPADFGLGSMVVVVVAFAQMFADAGVSSAIIYHHEPTKSELASLYWFNILCGAGIFALINLAAPLIVGLFNEPRLSMPLRLASFAFLITPFGQQFQFVLQKQLRFRSLAASSTSGYIAGLFVAVGLGVYGAGVYSLVFGQLANAFVRTAMLVRLQWRSRPSWHFARRDLSTYLSFGLYQTGDRAANFFNAYLLHGLIGSMLGAHVLGIYTLAFELAFKPLDAITPIVTRVAFPVLARIRDDLCRVRRGYLSMLRLLSTVNFPIALGTAALAPIIVPVIYGNAWRPAIPLVEVLALVALLRSSGSPIGALLLGLGKADWGFWWSAGKTLLQVPGLYVGIVVNQLYGAAVAYLALQLVFTAGAYALLVRKLLGPCVRDYVRAFLPALGLALAIAATIRIVSSSLGGTALVFQLLVLLAVGALAYLGFAAVFAKSLLAEMLQMVRSEK